MRIVGLEKIPYRNRTQCRFDEVNNGESFMFGSHIYIKLVSSNDFTNSFNLINKRLRYIPLDKIVEPVKTEVHIL